jgi:UDP-glucose 4-epimerase
MSGVLVTGATQPLGRALIDQLLARGRGPILAVGLEADGGFPEAVRYEQVDLSRDRQVKALIDGPVAQLGLHCVVHLAFHRDPDSKRAHKLHVDATRLMLRLSTDHPSITRFILRSTAEVYAARRDRPDRLREDHALALSSADSPWIRQRVQADVAACTRMGMSDLDVVVLRCAEILHADMGSQLYDYLQSRVCLRPLGFDPVLNLLSLDDAARAFALAVESDGGGVFNIPGADTLPLIWATQK